MNKPDKFSNFLDQTFKLDDYEGESKVLDLKEAVSRYVKPGMHIFISDRANALACELIRQYYGQRADFSLISLVATNQILNLIYCRICNKLITSSATEIHPTPGPSKVVQKAYKNKTIDIENWSLLSLTQRLMAGALGLPFMPTKSIAGTSMAKDNMDLYAEIYDPFNDESKVGVVKAITPDISLIHAWAADPKGNVIAAPYLFSGGDVWGAKASKKGVIVTVENIVPTSFIRENSISVSIPDYMVNCVILLPFGAHPQSMPVNFGIPEFETYSEDYEFSVQRRKASQNNNELDKWVKKWILDCRDHKDYLSMLGSRKLSALKDKAAGNSWKNSPAPDISLEDSEYNSREHMVVAASRRLAQLVLKKDYKTILFGIGTSCLAGYLAYYKLKSMDNDVELWLGGSGYYGFAPRPSNTVYPAYADAPTMQTSKMISDVISSYGIFIGGRQKSCISVLSSAQVDKYGNLNSTKVSSDSYIIGSGGGNDAVNANEVLLILPQSSHRLVEDLYYVTCPGTNITTLVTDMGIYQKTDQEFVLTDYFVNPSFTSVNDTVEKIRKNCGWELKIAPELNEVLPPSHEELMLLKSFDPKGCFLSR